MQFTFYNDHEEKKDSGDNQDSREPERP